MPRDNESGSLGVLRLLKEAEANGEERIKLEEIKAAAEIAEAKKHAAMLVDQATEKARYARELRLREARSELKQDVEGILGKARREAAMVHKFTTLDVEAMFPKVLEILLGDTTKRKTGAK
jgi:vacuolar-type H+-ATPase subunit H